MRPRHMARPHSTTYTVTNTSKTGRTLVAIRLAPFAKKLTNTASTLAKKSVISMARRLLLLRRLSRELRLRNGRVLCFDQARGGRVLTVRACRGLSLAAFHCGLTLLRIVFEELDRPRRRLLGAAADRQHCPDDQNPSHICHHSIALPSERGRWKCRGRDRGALRRREPLQSPLLLFVVGHLLLIG